MSIAKILVPVIGTKQDDVALATALTTARLFGAHVDTMFVSADPREAIPSAELTLTPEIVQNMVDTAEILAKEASKSARKSFMTCTTQANVKVVEAPQKTNEATASYREVVGHLPRLLAEAALLSDLIVFPTIIDSDNWEMHDAFVRVLTGVKRPVLLSAQAQPSHIAQRIAIGWDGRDAAARALIAALPYLRKAGAVELLSVQPSAGRAATFMEVRDYLALHGVTCSERVVDQLDRTVSETLLESATDSGCDLLIVGGYGHSRLLESIFGGTTKSMVSHPTLPILMVH